MSAANPYLSKYCYRLTHRDNLPHILQHGLCTKHHPNANPDFRAIGNPDIIGTRDKAPVRIEGKDYGTIGEYIPFYFTPRSPMLFNIVTGHRQPFVPKLPRDELIIFRSTAGMLSSAGQFFFTNGQANHRHTKHTIRLESLSRIDWRVIDAGDFSSKGDGSEERRRLYEAEFLIYQHLSLKHIESVVVFNKDAAIFVDNQMKAAGTSLPINIIPHHFFG